MQIIQLRQSEIKSKLNAELSKEEAEREEGALERLTREAQLVEIEYRAALVAHEETAEPDIVSTPEGLEMESLRGRVDFGNYVRSALAGGGGLAGAELELNQELNIPADYFPLSIMGRSGQLETRAKRDGDAEASQGTWLDRVFAMSAAERLGISFRSVSPGVAAYPVTTAGGSGVQRGRTEAASESTYTVSVEELKPTRNAVHGIYSVEDNMRLPGLADAIERDMRDAVVESVDRAIFKGDSGANENTADITGLQTAAIGESTLTQTNKVKGPETLSVFLNWIDGIHATTMAELNVVAAVGANTLWGSTIVNSAADNQTISQFLMASGMNWTTRGEIEAATAAGDFAAFAGLGRGIEGAGISAVWEAGQLVRDMYSNANSGEVKLTLNYLWAFALPRPANWKRLKFVS